MPLHVYWQEQILGVTTDRKLTFHQHIKKMCRKAGQKLSALLRLSSYLDINISTVEPLLTVTSIHRSPPDKRPEKKLPAELMVKLL